MGSNLDQCASYEYCRELASFPDNNRLRMICVVSYILQWHMHLWGNQQSRTKNKSITENVTASCHNGGLMSCILSLRLLLRQLVVYAGSKETLKQKNHVYFVPFKVKATQETSGRRSDKMLFFSCLLRIRNLISCEMWQLFHVNIHDNRVRYTVAEEGEALLKFNKTLVPIFRQLKVCCVTSFVVSAFKSGRCNW